VGFWLPPWMVWPPSLSRDRKWSRITKCTFFLQNVHDLFSLVAALETQSQTTKLTAPTLKISPAHQNMLWNLTSCFVWGCTYNLYPYKLRLFFSPLWGLHVHPVPLATLFSCQLEQNYKFGSVPLTLSLQNWNSQAYAHAGVWKTTEEQITIICVLYNRSKT